MTPEETTLARLADTALVPDQKYSDRMLSMFRFRQAANPSAIKSLFARIAALEKDSARLNALEKLVNFGVWQGSWAEHMGEKAGKPIVDINEMCDDGQEIVRHISRGETLREAIDAILGGENDQGDR